MHDELRSVQMHRLSAVCVSPRPPPSPSPFNIVFFFFILFSLYFSSLFPPRVSDTRRRIIISLKIYVNASATVEKIDVFDVCGGGWWLSLTVASLQQGRV